MQLDDFAIRNSEDIYSHFKFNELDKFLRENFELYASQIIFKESLPLVYRSFANRGNVEKLALLCPSQVLEEEELISEHDSYLILYLPKTKLYKDNKANLSEKVPEK
jgi:hypothetical protein